jgi:hypothetical protein
MTVNGTTYSNVSVFGANSTDIFFSSDQGVRNVKLKFLSPDLQKQFNYAPEEAAKVEEQQIADDQRYQSNVAAAITAQFEAAKRHREALQQAPYAQAGLGDAVGDASPLGKTAPEIESTSWVGGTANINRKFAIISVWSPKSASCRKWIPALNNIRTNLTAKLEIVGVTTATAEEVMQCDPKPEFPCALDPDGKFMKDANITMLPCVLLVDTNGTVRYEGHPAALSSGVLQEVFTNAPAE